MDRAQIALIGIFSFEGADPRIVNIDPADVVGSVGREGLVRARRALVAFRPTRVIVQEPVALKAQLHGAYRTYLSGSLEGLLAKGEDRLVRSELYQLAFRVADLLYLPGLFPVDSAGGGLCAPDEPLGEAAIIENMGDTLFERLVAVNSREYLDACAALWEGEEVPQAERRRNRDIADNILEIIRPERTLVFLSAQRCAPVGAHLMASGRADMFDAHSLLMGEQRAL